MAVRPYVSVEQLSRGEPIALARDEISFRQWVVPLDPGGVQALDSRSQAPAWERIPLGSPPRRDG